MASFDSLSMELVVNICEFVRNKHDQTNACLVNRTFCSLVSANLWKTFSTDLCCDDAELFDTLVHPKSNILPNIKHFHLEETDTDCRFQAVQQDRFTIFMMALPRNKLVEFSSEVRFGSKMFRMLVQCQQQLHKLEVTLSESLVGMPVLSPYLAAVEHICIQIYGDVVHSARRFKNYGPLLLQTPKLDSLQIKAPKLARTDAAISIRRISFPALGDGSGKFSLKRLELAKLYLDLNHTRISNHITLETLATLKLDDCVKCGPFLAKLSSEFAGSICALKRLHVKLRSGSSDTTHDINHLIMSFKGLETLYLSLDKPVSTNSIINHSLTLTSFGFSSDISDSTGYTRSEWTSILKACTLLTQLGIDFDTKCCEWNDLGYDLFVDSANREWSHLSTSKGFLKVIASHPSLCSIRALDPSFLDWMKVHNPDKSSSDTIPTDTVELAAAAIHVFATQTLRYLHIHGSKIRYLAWKPLSSSYAQPYKLEFEGEVIPSYAYYKGRANDDTVVKRVVAIPVDGYEQEMRESSIFFDF
ncbi:hypothetical protein BDU57DRAFT_547046 [Ampelomyces quisqualis]|uniref:Uncharacterized protein n=1 Tax=Ampelomyces quisqualis TaxID=50730 RepID=A0A6A5QR62_AMPQU|nr:hypothetical protein BDU57DRAFT_547046 [Ampelomyces quisqualis]